jgi:hypothetical protein
MKDQSMQTPEDKSPLVPVQAIVRPKPTNQQVRSYILQLLDDEKKHDWDDTLSEVGEAFEKIGERTAIRQEEECLAELVAEGLVIEEESEWEGMMTLRRIRQTQQPSTQQQRQLFSV